ncbi:hypothetical protein FRB96_001323 [Tulasnella sp. 330]|nr:hypothetical protein FRB96_001323 [Tulasnella sp. 330]KAG8880432.1 hypothetical protein FRB97_000796 [Tulasnella sp. 331]KAG8888376.1 hypothetical protein FRB98_007771 [Tulasnella sp. 332]
MPHSYGYRARTRHMFAKDFKDHGVIKLSTYLTTYRIGDIVDIKANSTMQRGMPHKYYHGKTGVIYNVTPRAVGVIIRKPVNNRYIEKRVNVRIEHVRHSKCRVDFLARVKENQRLIREAMKKGEKVDTRRVPAQPRPGHSVSTEDNLPETLAPLRFEINL